ncbi:MAG TPA: thioredoxin family protein [Candidatus Babeliales bacterium]|nr:thioredoxin family protein [Candidatus Babeliales bacterium]
MKIYNKKIVKITMLCVLLVGGFLQAKVRAITTRRDFEQRLSKDGKDGMVVVLFYESQKRNGDARNRNKGLTRMYEDLSNYQPYNDADVVFLKVNTGRKELADLALLYSVKTVPTFIFFNSGKRCVDDQGSAIVLNGFVSRVDLQSFIDQYYGAEVKRRVAEKEDRRDQRMKEEGESWKPYFYPRDIFVRDYDTAESKKNME